MTAKRFPKFRELAGDAANGMYYATHFSMATIGDLPAAQSFAKDFRATYGKDPDFIDAEAYDAATAAILAIEKAGKVDRTAVQGCASPSRIRWDPRSFCVRQEGRSDVYRAHRSRQRMARRLMGAQNNSNGASVAGVPIE